MLDSPVGVAHPDERSHKKQNDPKPPQTTHHQHKGNPSMTPAQLVQIRTELTDFSEILYSAIRDITERYTELCSKINYRIGVSEAKQPTKEQ
jgi:hypothetical protein